jgi:hypothetical protein
MNTPKINVVIRIRPLSKKELANNDMDITDCHGRELVVRELKQKVDLTKYIEEHGFVFDAVFNQSCDNLYVGCYNLDIRENSQTPDRPCLYGRKGLLFCIRANR